MTLKALLFVSISRIDRAGEADALHAIVGAGRARNEALGVRAALVAARGCLAELLEGPPESIDVLMRSIRADPRHDEVTVVVDKEGTTPQLRGSAMDPPYHGDSFSVARHIRPLIGDRLGTVERLAAAAQLIFLIRELVPPKKP